MINVTNLRNGTVFEDSSLGKEPYIVVKYSHVKVARGGAVVKLKVKGLKSCVVKEVSFKGNDRVHEADVSKKGLQYLYADESRMYFMDPATFEQAQLPLDWANKRPLKLLKGGENLVVTFYKETPILVEFPKTVSLKVEYTEPGFKGDTATTVLKPARLETGAEIRVPLFIKIGDMIKVKTDTMGYAGKF